MCVPTNDIRPCSVYDNVICGHMYIGLCKTSIGGAYGGSGYLWLANVKRFNKNNMSCVQCKHTAAEALKFLITHCE